MRLHPFHSIFLTLIMLLCSVSVQAANQFVVVIDPGHGGGDVGTPHRKCKQDEKTVALNVALKLGAMIKEKNPEVKIVYTRDTDVYPTLPDRTRIARQSKGHLFISIHVNAALDGSAKGFETYVFGITGLQGKSESEQKRIRERTMIERENLDIDGKQIDFETAVDIETKILCQTQREKHNKYSQEIAHYVQDQLMSDLRRSDYRNYAQDRGVKQKNIFVLCYSPMPAILVELGYMSNVKEEKFITTDDAQTLFAGSIYKGFCQYYTNWRHRQLKEFPEPEPEVKPVIPEERKPETKKEAKPVVKEEKPAVKEVTTEPKPEVKEEPKPETKGNIEVENKKEETPVTAEAKSEPEPKVKEEIKEEPKPEVKEEVMTVASIPAKECYRIQFVSSTRLLQKGAPELKGLWPVQYYQVNEYYRYTIGEAKEKAELQTQILEIRKNFPDAFIVHFDASGNRIK